MLKSAFRMAYDANVIQSNIMQRADFRAPKSAKRDKKVRGLTEAEQIRFLKALDEHVAPFGSNEYKHQLRIELYSGMRMGEINALKPENIDFESGFIRVRRTISSGVDGKPIIKEGTKSEAGQRDIPINTHLEKVLREALADSKKNPEGLIFYDFKKKGAITTNQVNGFFRRICAKAGIEYYGQHSLRHTFATRSIEAGITPVVLRTWMGHTNIHITLDTYADVFERMNDDSVEKFDKLMDLVKSEE